MIGAPITPATPAMKAARKKTKIEKRGRLMPRAMVVSLSSIPARMTAPTRVLSCSHHRPTAVARPKTMIASRARG